MSSQKNWFKQKENRSLEDKGGNQQNIPSMNELETFWRGIWKRPESVNEEVWTEIMTVMNKYVEISIQGDDNPNLTVKHLKRVLRKIKTMGRYRLGPTGSILVEKDNKCTLYLDSNCNQNV